MGCSSSTVANAPPASEPSASAQVQASREELAEASNPDGVKSTGKEPSKSAAKAEAKDVGDPSAGEDGGQEESDLGEKKEEPEEKSGMDTQAAANASEATAEGENDALKDEAADDLGEEIHEAKKHSLATVGRKVSSVAVKAQIEKGERRPLVLVGGLGCGKRTLLKELVKDHGDLFQECISYTTRPKREDEEEGKDHYFVDDERFREMQDADMFCHAVMQKTALYGIDWESITEAGREKIPVMSVERESAIDLHSVGPFMKLQPRFVLVKPPSYDYVEERIKEDNKDNPELVEEILAKEREYDETFKPYEEMKAFFDMIIVNDDPQDSLDLLMELVNGKNWADDMGLF